MTIEARSMLKCFSIQMDLRMFLFVSVLAVNFLPEGKTFFLDLPYINEIVVALV